MVFVGVFMMPFYYGSRARSVPEYLRLRFDEKTRGLNAVSFAIMNVAAKWMAEVSGVKPTLGTVPDGVEVYPRYGDHGAVYILVNLSKAEQTVALPSAMTDVIDGGSKQSVRLPVYGVAVLSK